MTANEHLDPAAIAAYLDHGLAPSDREGAAAHLADCDRCRERLAAQAKAEERGARVVPIGGRRAPSWAPMLAAAAVGAVLLGVTLWFALGGGERARETAERGREPAAERPEGVAPLAQPGGPAPAATVTPEGATPRRDPPDAPAGELTRREPERGARRPPGADGAPPPGPEDELLALRGGVKRVEGKVFRLRDQVWVDQAYRERDHGAPREVSRGTAEYQALLAREPRLAAWSGVGARVVVLLDSIPHRILPAP